MTVKNIRNGTLKIRDGKTSYNEIEVAFEEGNLKFDTVKNIVEVLDRGSLGDMIEGNEESIKGSFATHFREFLAQDNAAGPTEYEALQRKGKANHWVSTWTNSNVYAVKLIFEIAATRPGDKAERITFNYAHITKVGFEEGADTDKLSFEFTDFETEPTIEKF